MKGVSGIIYQVEILAFWDNKPDEDTHVIRSIDDRGIRAYFPLSNSFIMSRNGTFVNK